MGEQKNSNVKVSRIDQKIGEIFSTIGNKISIFLADRSVKAMSHANFEPLKIKRTRSSATLKLIVKNKYWTISENSEINYASRQNQA